MAKKPTGTSGPFVVSVSDDGTIAGTHRKIEWPTDQKEIERKVLGWYVKKFEETGAKFLKIEDGGTRDLDFLLTLPGGKAYLELMEVVIPLSGALPYGPGHRRYEPIPYAEAAFTGVQRKIDKYGFNHQTPIDLLMYVTHEQYNPNGAALHALSHIFLNRAHSFHYVFFLIPASEEFCTLHVLYNRDQPIAPPPLETLADRTWVNLVASEAKIDK